MTIFSHFNEYGLIMEFYELEIIVSLDNKYVRYEEECPDKFKVDMK